MSGARFRSFEITSDLHASRDEVWRIVTNMDRVNDELAPWLRMTTPEPGLTLDDARVVPGARLFRSWLLVFGVVPVDYDDVVLDRCEPGRSFHERSSMFTQRAWHHDRVLDSCPSGTRLTDRLAWAPRFPGAGALFARVVPHVFLWRHRRLRRRFGGRLVGCVGPRSVSG